MIAKDFAQPTAGRVPSAAAVGTRHSTKRACIGPATASHMVLLVIAGLIQSSNYRELSRRPLEDALHGVERQQSDVHQGIMRQAPFLVDFVVGSMFRRVSQGTDRANKSNMLARNHIGGSKGLCHLTGTLGSNQVDGRVCGGRDCREDLFKSCPD